MNLTGQKISAGTAPSEILPLLGDQLVNCVLWEPSVLGMIKARVGPGWIPTTVCVFLTGSVVFVCRMALRSSMSVGQ